MPATRDFRSRFINVGEPDNRRYRFDEISYDKSQPNRPITTVPHYLLAKHIFGCEIYGQVVFLDLNRDKYFRLDREDSALVIQFVNPPTVSDTYELNSPASANERASQVADHLVMQGILTPPVHGAEGRGLTRRSSPTTTIHGAGDKHDSNIDAREVFRFLRSGSSAAWRLRRWPLLRTVTTMRLHKEGRRTESNPNNLERTRHLVRAFDAMRPIFPREYLCLFDSLALMYFLLDYEISPEWVFGVKTDPFEAHCWLELGGVLLNDTPEFVRDFSAIMVV